MIIKSVIEYVRLKVRKLLDHYFGRVPKMHKIPFGPLKGENILMSFNDCPAIFFGYHEIKLLKIAERNIKAGQVIYDVGAHLGYNSLFYSRLVSDCGSVHAFELIPETANMLKKTIENSDSHNIYIHNIGLGKEHIKKTFIYDDRKMGSILYREKNIMLKPGNRFTTIAEIYSLDEYFSINNLDPPNFIKVDIEGGEIDFLNGASHVISKFRPDLMIEFRDLAILKRGYEFLNNQDYVIYQRYIDRSNFY